MAILAIFVDDSNAVIPLLLGLVAG